MAKRKAHSPAPIIGNLKTEIAFAEVENPLYARDHDGARGNVRNITAAINVRESAVTMLAAKGVLNAPQVAAANWFRQRWETMGGAGAGAMDYTREPVDGGGGKDPISDRQIIAGSELNAAFGVLTREHGIHAYRLVCRICGEGYSIHDLCSTRRERDTMTDNLRTYLDALAGWLGFSTKAGVIHRPVSKVS